MRCKVFAGFFVLIFVFVLINLEGVYSLEEDFAPCLSDSDDLSYFTSGYLTLSNDAILEDFCLEYPNDRYLVEFICDEGKTLAQYYPCASACSAGKCVSDLNAQNTLGNDGTASSGGSRGGSSVDYSVDEVDSEEDSVQQANTNKCEGCLAEGECFSEGIRLVSGFGQERNYCGSNGIIRPQKADDSSCEENYECLGNVCLDGKCKSSKNTLSKVSFFERGLVRLSCLFVNGEKKNSCLLKNAKQWGII